MKLIAKRTECDYEGSITVKKGNIYNVFFADDFYNFLNNFDILEIKSSIVYSYGYIYDTFYTENETREIKINQILYG